AVLVFDRRPSWMSTFVRRVLEDDPRFDVASRTSTSTLAASTTLDAPAGLSDVAALWRDSAIVVGAPETLTDADVEGLNGYLRNRGGAVVALYDTAPGDKPSAIDKLLSVHGWQTETTPAPRTISAHGAAALEATETAQ